MKKINSIKQLEAQIERTGRRQDELEKSIAGNWKELKAELRPGKLKSSFVKGWLDAGKEPAGRTTLQRVLTYGTILFARRAAGKAISKAIRFFKKG
jgi:hypothetical protein